MTFLMLLDRSLLIVAPRFAGTYLDDMPLEPRSSWNRPFARRKKRAATFKQPRGVWNTGQSCHLGAVLSALSAVSCMRAWVMNQPALWRPPVCTLADYLLQAASSKQHSGGLDPRPVLALLDKAGWKSRHAQDAHESMLRVLDLVEEATNSFPRHAHHRPTLRISRSAKAPPLCIGRTHVTMDWKRKAPPPYISTTASWNHCFSCGHTSPVTLTDSPMILVPVAERSKPLAALVTSAMYSATRVDMYCEGCGQSCTHVHYSEVWRLPRALILLLQRASYGTRGVSITRSQLWFYKYINIARPYHGDVCYALRSVVRHSGGASGYSSHYDCIVRAPESCAKGIDGVDLSSRWWHVDDDRISRSSVHHACDTSHVYLLMFEMET